MSSLSLIDPDLVPVIQKSQYTNLSIPHLKRQQNVAQYDNSDLFDTDLFTLDTGHIIKKTHITNINELYAICAKSLSKNDLDFILCYCDQLKNNNYYNISITLAGDKSDYVYDYIHYFSKKPLPIIIVSKTFDRRDFSGKYILCD